MKPTRFREEYVERAYELCLLGYTIDQLAATFSCTDRTIQNWMHNFPAFKDAIYRGRELADAKVAASLYHRALGYEHEAVKIFLPAGAEKPVYAKYTERYPPDTGAISLWLRNRQPGKWHERTEHTGAGGGPIATEVVYRWATPDEVK